jgi:hypothetical protein
MVQPSNLPRRHRSGLRCGLQAAGGLSAIMIGCYAVLCIFAFSSMIDPHLACWERWRLILEKMTLTLNVIPLTLGGVLTCGGVVATVVSLHRLAFGAIGPKRSAVFIVPVAMLTGATFLLALVGIFM